MSLETLKGRHLVNKIVEDVAGEYGLTVEELRSGHRGKMYVDCRREIACKLHDIGYSYSEIAEGINRHHAAVVNLMRGRNAIQ